MSDYIPEDNLVLILKQLPVKALVRFRTVSKWWKQIIESPCFVQDHLSLQKPRFIVECRGEYTVIDPRPRPLVHTISKPIEKKNFILVGTLNGVVCLYETDSDFVIWNPSLHKFSSLRSGFKWGYWGGVQHSFGFWIDSSTKEFKIIVLQRQRKHDLRNFQSRSVVDCVLYSSVRRDWSVVPCEKLGNWKSCIVGPPVIVGGVVHWGGCLEDSMYECDYEHIHDDKVVLSFDFVQESFELIKMPDVEFYMTAPCCWQGALSLVCCDSQFRRNCEIYLRRDDSWVKMFSFEVDIWVTHIFCAMEDMEARTRKGKRKREMEERIDGVVGKRENVRVLATSINDTRTLTCDLLFEGTKSGTRIVKRGLAYQSKVNTAYDFVESLLFPEAVD